MTILENIRKFLGKKKERSLIKYAHWDFTEKELEEYRLRKQGKKIVLSENTSRIS